MTRTTQNRFNAVFYGLLTAANVVGTRQALKRQQYFVAIPRMVLSGLLAGIASRAAAQLYLESAGLDLDSLTTSGFNLDPESMEALRALITEKENIA